MGPNGEEGGVITTRVDGVTVEVTFTKCGSRFYYVAGCPNSNGDAGTAGEGRLNVTTRTLEGGRLISSHSTDWTGGTGCSAVGMGRFVQAGDATRTVRVNMSSGSDNTAQSSAAISGDAGAFAGDDLAASIQMAIQEYKDDAENGGSFLHTDGWATFERKRDPYCAKAIFTPLSEARRVRKAPRSRCPSTRRARTVAGRPEPVGP